MPVHSGRDTKGCYEQWGNHGAKYYYRCGNVTERNSAKKKAGEQGRAAIASGYKPTHENKLDSQKVSFDYDGTLTLKRIQDKVRSLISSGAEVYIISARNHKATMIALAHKLGILQSRIYATGSNKAKVEKVLSLGIDTHYDNNPDVIKELGSVGNLV